MSRTFFRQETQIRNSDVYDDTIAAGSTLESAAANLENDVNAIRSQMKRTFWADAAGNWYDDIATFNSKKRGLFSLNEDLDDIEEKKFLFRTQVLTDVSVPVAQNWVVLSVTGAEAPTLDAAVTSAQNGAVVAVLGDGLIGSHQLTEVVGVDAISPKNLLVIRDATTGEKIQAADGKDVYGLIQAQFGVVDGETFNDTDKRVQISFVKENATGDDLVAVPVADIESKSLNYSYVQRINLDIIPETAFLQGVFVDKVASVDVTLDNAIDNQVGPATQEQDIFINMDADQVWSWRNAAGTTTYLSIDSTGTGTITVNGGEFLSTATANNFDNGLSVDTTGTQLDIGVTSGEISSAGALTVITADTFDLKLDSGNEILFDDVNKVGSSWTGELKLSDTTLEWDDYFGEFGEASLMAAIYQASQAGGARGKAYAVVTPATIPADTNVTGAGGSPNIDAQLLDYSVLTFVTEVNIYLNGQLLRNGADGAANFDVYPGDSPANGDLKFEFQLRGGARPDVITMETFADMV